jgi:hypothetical protein
MILVLAAVGWLVLIGMGLRRLPRSRPDLGRTRLAVLGRVTQSAASNGEPPA